MCHRCMTEGEPYRNPKYAVIVTFENGTEWVRHFLPCKESARYVEATYYPALPRNRLTMMTFKHFLDTHPPDRWGFR